MLTDRRRRVVLVPVEEDGTTKACVRSNTKVLLLGSPRIEDEDNMRNVKARKASLWLLLPLVIYLPI